MQHGNSFALEFCGEWRGVCTNQEGETSVKSSVEVERKNPGKNISAIFRPMLYYIGIGVSEYNDADWNLNFSAADVNDIAKQLMKPVVFDENKMKNQLLIKTGEKYIDKFRLETQREMSQRYARVDTQTLTNRNATRSKIRSLKDKLMKTMPDDVVILSFSGHGLRDSSDFYFATYDMNFSHPKQYGLSMAISSGCSIQFLHGKNFC